MIMLKPEPSRAVLAAWCAALLAVPAAAGAQSLPHSPDLYVAEFFGSTVQRFSGPLSPRPGADHPAPGRSGSVYAGPVGRRPWGIAFGPDGNLYIANQQGGGGAVHRVKGPFSDAPGDPLPAPGMPEDVFVAEGNALVLAFGLDGNLLVGIGGPILRYDIVTGRPLGAFTSGRALLEVAGLALGPDQNLYVSATDAVSGHPAILRFDGRRGAFIDTFVAPGGGGMLQPAGIGFGTNGDLFVCDFSSETGAGAVLRFHGPLDAAAGQPFPAADQPGARFAQAAGVFPTHLAFGPDRTLYVTGSRTGDGQGVVLKFNGRSGAALGTFATVAGGARGLAFAIGRE